MKSEKLIPGLILVLLGAVFLLDNFHVIDFRWGNILHLWPVFLIMGGVNLVFANNKAPWATALKIGVVILGFGLLVFGHFESRWWPNNGRWNFNDKGWYKDGDDNDDNDDDDDDSDDNRSDSTGIVKVEGSSTYTEPYAATATDAKLNISGGGTLYALKDTTNQLFTATTKERRNRYIYTHTMEGNVPVLNLRMKDKNGWHGDDNNSATIKLNANPIWDINVKAGATELNFDLSPFKIKHFEINGGAASFHVKLGQPLAETNVEVSTGVSEVVISVPANAATRITSDTGLSSNEFNGFDKKGDNTYESAGFDAAKNKIVIHVRGGLSDVKVVKY